MKYTKCNCGATYNPETTSQCPNCGGSGKAPQSRKRGKRVRGAPIGALIRELLKTHQVSTVVQRMAGKVGKTVIYEIAKEEKTGEPQSMPAEQFLARYGDKIDLLMRQFLERSKPRCQLSQAPPSDETVIEFVQMTHEEYLARERRRIERLKKVNEEFLARVPPPLCPKCNPDEYAQRQGYGVFEKMDRNL